MATWGTGAFQNDQALEWLADLEREPDLTLVEGAVAAIALAEDDEYLDGDDCSVALAAAEIVAAVGGRPSPRLPETVAAWCRHRGPPEPELIQDAQAAIRRVRDDSELRVMFSDKGSADPRWLKGLAELEARLRAVEAVIAV